jgi:hypothetical protein
MSLDLYVIKSVYYEIGMSLNWYVIKFALNWYVIKFVCHQICMSLN